MFTFHDWLRNRPDGAPAADRLATLIAQYGTGGVSCNRLRQLVPLSPETVHDLLRSLTATRQVVVVKIDGQLVYRATM